MATTFFSVVIILLFINLSIKLYQYSFGKIYKGEVVDVTSIEVIKRSRNGEYKSYVYPQKIKFTDYENKIWFYSEASWDEEMRYEINEKIEVLESKEGNIYIFRLFSFWLNTTNLVVIFGLSIFLTLIVEAIKEKYFSNV